MVDRADWTDIRKAVLTPTVRGTWKSNKVEFEKLVVDVASNLGRSQLESEIPRADVIVCPSIISEVITDGLDHDLMTWLLHRISDTARLMLIDHTTTMFRQREVLWEQVLDVVDKGKTSGFILPPLQRWVMEDFLRQNAPDLKPKGSYVMSWSVLAPKQGAGQNRG